VRALASILSTEGRVFEARILLKRQLEVDQVPATRVVVLTDLARMLWEKPGDAEASCRTWTRRCCWFPITCRGRGMADVLERETELARDRAPAGTAAASPALRWARRWLPLHQRLADVYERLGRLGRSYRQLQDVERLQPGRLAVRLAMGANRYANRKWREAIAHLETLAEHRMPPRTRWTFAQGLYLAAQSEQKSKNTERAASCSAAP